MKTPKEIQVFKKAFLHSGLLLDAIKPYEKGLHAAEVFNVNTGLVNTTHRQTKTLDMTAHRELKVWAHRVFSSMWPHLTTYLDSLNAPTLNTRLIPEGLQLLKYEPGGHYAGHVDAWAGATHRVVSAILYLNDNFVGGDLQFTNQKLTIHPSPGTLVLFPSNFCYPHVAHPVTEGIRYCLVTWFTVEHA